MNEVARCMTCKAKKEFKGEPVYKIFSTKKGIKALLSGFCDQGHKMSLLCKVRV